MDLRERKKLRMGTQYGIYILLGARMQVYKTAPADRNAVWYCNLDTL